MSYLVTQIWLLLVTSFVLGAAFGWLLRGWLSQRLAVALLDARARHAADATETARQRSELIELKERGKRLEADLVSQKLGNEQRTAELQGVKQTLVEQADRLQQALERQAELDALRAAAGSTVAALESRVAAMSAELDQTRERLRHESQLLASCRIELAQAQEQLRHQLELHAGPLPDESQAPAEAPAAMSGALSPDDLEQIVGVGPKLKSLLHALGIRHYAQIAHWSDIELEQAARQLPGFGSRIRRDDWRGQCRVLHRLKYGSEI